MNVSTQRTSLASRTACHSTVFSASRLWVLTGYVHIQKKHFAYPAKHLYESILKDNKRVGFLPEPASGSEAVVPSGCIPALGGAGSADTDVCDHQVPQWMPLKQTGLMAIKSQVQSAQLNKGKGMSLLITEGLD